jgi:hypothetical protein
MSAIPTTKVFLGGGITHLFATVMGEHPTALQRQARNVSHALSTDQQLCVNSFKFGPTAVQFVLNIGENSLRFREMNSDVPGRDFARSDSRIAPLKLGDSHFGLERGCVVVTSRSTSQISTVLVLFHALRLVFDTAARSPK